MAFGGWSIDLHPSDGVYSKLPGCNQYHSKGIYQIPYRCYISKDINNLFYAGRIISASHVAFGSSRVMATCAHGGQAVGTAAAICIEKNLQPFDILSAENLRELQRTLNTTGQSIPNIPIDIKGNLLSRANVSVSSETSISNLPADGPWRSLDQSAAQMLPMKKGVQYNFELILKATEATILNCELRTSAKATNHTPDENLEQIEIELHKGEQKVRFGFNTSLKEDKYGFIVLLKNELVQVRTTEYRQTALLSVFNKKHLAVSNQGVQKPPKGSGFDAFEFWTPERRPEGRNIAMEIQPPIADFGLNGFLNGYTRPTNKSNAWVADLSDPKPRLELQWNKPQKIHGLQLHFDTDFDHPLESSLQGHPESIVPFVVRNYSIRNCNEEIIYKCKNNHQTINKVMFPEPVMTAALKVELDHPSKNVPASMFFIQIILKLYVF